MSVRTRRPADPASTPPASKRAGKRSTANSNSRRTKPTHKTSSRSPRPTEPVAAATTTTTAVTKKKKGPARGTHYTTRRLRGDASLPNRNRPLTDANQRSARNLLREIGGDEALLEVLDESEHPRAPKLADLMRSADVEVQSRKFGRKVLDSGLTPAALAEILYERQKTKAFVQVAMDLPEVIAGVIRRAKDSFERCDNCHGHGKRLTTEQRNNQLPPDEDAPVCLSCDGTGWLLISGEPAAIELFAELARLKKSGQQNFYDFSKKMLNQNQFNQPNIFLGGGDGNGGGQPPSIDSIIKRADEQQYLPAPSTGTDQLTNQRPVGGEVMPEEAELVED